MSVFFRNHKRFFTSTCTLRTSNLTHFDTFKFVERLEKEQFTRQQSEAIMTTLRIVVSRNHARSHCTYGDSSRKRKGKEAGELFFLWNRTLMDLIAGYLYVQG